jgi:hypothetical protein
VRVVEAGTVDVVVGAAGAGAVVGVVTTLIVTLADVVTVAGPLLPARSVTVFVLRLMSTEPSSEQVTVTVIEVPEAELTEVEQPGAVPVRVKSDAASPLTDSLKARV